MKRVYVNPQLEVIKIQTQQMLAMSVNALDELDSVVETTDEFNLIPTVEDVLPTDPNDDNIFL
jgi:hypothetical protein